jgi:hypothetical protein
MTSLAAAYQAAMTGATCAPFSVARFTPAEIRTAMSELVASEQLLLADALGIAALSFYPHSEDVLATCALLAEVRQDWVEADGLLGRLIALNGMSASATTWLHWMRVIQCRHDTERALAVGELAVCEHPHDIPLQRTLAELSDIARELPYPL